MAHDLAIEIYEGPYTPHPNSRDCLTAFDLPPGATAPSIGDTLSRNRDGGDFMAYRVTARTHLITDDKWLKLWIFVERV